MVEAGEGETRKVDRGCSGDEVGEDAPGRVGGLCLSVGAVSRQTGTVTFLFTDIEGSTQRWEADPDGMRAALAEHDAVLRAAIEGHEGWLFKHTGDGVIAAFGSARAALGAAIAAVVGVAGADGHRHR